MGLVIVDHSRVTAEHVQYHKTSSENCDACLGLMVWIGGGGVVFSADNGPETKIILATEIYRCLQY